MSRLFIPAVHLPHGREVFKPLPYRASQFRRVLKAYAERALLQCAPEDAIVLAAAPETDYLRFLMDNGMGTERIILCPGAGGNLAADLLGKDFPGRIDGRGIPNFYIHLEEEWEIAKTLGARERVMHPALTRMFNTAYFLLRLEEDMAIAAPPRAQVRSSRFAEPVRELLKEHGKLFVRGNESCGGTQTFTVENEEEIAPIVRIIGRNREITRYFASPFLAIDESWNVQYAIGPDGVSALFGASRQIMAGTAHKGNEGGAEIPPAVARLAETTVRRLASMGARGMIGIDFISAGGATYIAEINARENTSTPVIAAAQRAGARHWRSFKIPVARGFTFAAFAALCGKENLLTAAAGRGLLPFHFAASSLTGWLDVAAYGESLEEVAALESRVRPTE
ncbi:MAG: ATP-grasp domain-containing protein [Nitrospinae bacterium]|nr:ATP-grasp domain-containing protein [Nitrospinota bacterium]